MSPTTTHNLLSQSAGLALYAVTLAAHALSAIVRALITYVVLALAGLLTGWPVPANTIALLVAFAPLAVSLLSLPCPPLIAPIDGRWWEMSTGGRPPEQDEREAFERAFGQLQQADPKLRAPRHWFVAEEPGCKAAAYAASLRVDRGLLESPYADAARHASEQLTRRGLPPPPRTTPHTLRRTYISITLLANNFDVKWAILDSNQGPLPYQGLTSE